MHHYIRMPERVYPVDDGFFILRTDMPGLTDIVLLDGDGVSELPELGAEIAAVMKRVRAHNQLRVPQIPACDASRQVQGAVMFLNAVCNTEGVENHGPL